MREKGERRQRRIVQAISAINADNFSGRSSPAADGESNATAANDDAKSKKHKHSFGRQRRARILLQKSDAKCTITPDFGRNNNNINSSSRVQQQKTVEVE